MASPTITYASPSEGHTPIGSPVPSQIRLQRVASPNHIVSQHGYVDSPRSVPAEYSQYSAPTEHFEYDQGQELYVNDDPHVYDFGPGGPLPVEHQFVQPQQNVDANLLYMVPVDRSSLTIVPCSPNSTTHAHAWTFRKSYTHACRPELDDSIFGYS
jgi:hypothetical protein